jgi:hypothetical protein
MEGASHAARRGALTAPLRRALIGALAGGATSVALPATALAGSRAGIILLAALIGAAAALADPYGGRKTTLDGGLTFAVLGIPVWALIDVIVVAAFASGAPAWTAPEMRAAFPAFVGWIVYGASLALLIRVAGDAVDRLAGPLPAAVACERGQLPPPTRVVVPGGGFAGVTTAQTLERLFGAERDVVLTRL